MLKKLPLIVKELFISILFYGFVVEIVVLSLLKDKIFYSVGLGVGLLIAMGMCIHMYQSLDYATDMEESQAKKHIRKTYALRTAIIFILVLIMYYFNAGSILTGFIGIMSLKVAAYIQPFTHKLLEKYNKKGR
ncbi:hypothetical protein [Konateibacter massiliensis]|uniref:hypothetical protein n=1 Tax=Konateibacter massiliensis TaxID=2002841 RepID=UPI000C14A8D5|nr:hypothetical protein [Konateibacter massiliensis]